MRHATIEALNLGDVLGFVIGCIKDNYKAILIKYDGNYYVISANYTKGESSVSRKIGRWWSSIKFETPEVCDDWWESYLIVREKAITQIYI